VNHDLAIVGVAVGIYYGGRVRQWFKNHGDRKTGYHLRKLQESMRDNEEKRDKQ
jgi:hypothetical protein